ncbi:EAL domain-containing protein [Candidatus Uhrbacteria bacterium]|nr:EAL domain-containing protein [Candidatus Uhrbacteria bacterium]
MPHQLVTEVEREAARIADIQAVIPQALLPRGSVPLSRDQERLRRKYLRYFLNPTEDPPGRMRAITCGEIGRFIHSMVVGLHLYQDIDSKHLLKRIPPRRAIKGAESFMRLIDEDEKVIPFGQFKKAAEDREILSYFSLNAIRTLRQIGTQVNDGGGAEAMFLSANVPHALWADENRAEPMLDALDTPMPVGEMGLEVLEYNVIPDDAVQFLRGVTRERGIQVLVDDYPEQHALENLEKLREARVPVRAIKISGKTVKTLNNAASIRAMQGHIEMAQQDEPTIVIAEGCPGGIPATSLSNLQDLYHTMLCDYPHFQMWFQGNPMPY